MANEKISGMGFHHVALKAVDFDKSYKFYTEGLGMKLHAMWGEGNGRAAMLDFGDGGILELFAGGVLETRSNPHYLHFALKVDDVDKAYKTAIDAGALPMQAPATVTVDATPAPVTLNFGFVYGPDGEELEFFRFV